MFLFTMGNSDNQKAGAINKRIREIISVLDLAFFGLLSLAFQLFFNVTSVEIFSGEFIMNFYNRVQVILGVFMMFQLAMTIIKGIVDPDSFNDKKTGAASLIRRIAIALVMLVLLVPIRYNNPANEYETQLNNNGILFGTLYSLQYRILKENTLGKIIFGDKYEDHNYMGDPSSLKSASNKFVGSLIRSFYRINLKKDNGDINDKEEWMCGDGQSGWPKGVYKAYTNENTSPSELISLVSESCKSKKKFVLAYTPILPAIVGIIMSVLILSFTIDVGIRTIKLGILKLIAPIPIISYMDPKGSKDSAFNSWVKQLTSTYIDLFVRLAIIYLAVYLVINISQNGLIVTDSVPVDEGIGWRFTQIIIYIALFAFAKQAPKFLKDMFGIKDDGVGFGGLFKGIGTAMGVGAVAAGALSGGISRAAAYDNRDQNPFKRLAKGAANLGAGTIGGGWNAGKDLLTKKDANAKDIMSANRARNMQNYSNAADDSTARGRFVAGLQSNLGLKNKAQEMDEKIKYYNAAEDSWKRTDNALNSDGSQIRGLSTIKDKAGNVLFTAKDPTQGYSNKEINDLLNRMKSSGQYSQDEIEAVEDARKQAQQLRTNEIITKGGTTGSGLTGTEAQIYQGVSTIYTIGKKYAKEDDKVFEAFQRVGSITDIPTSLGATPGDFSKNIKGSAYGAGRQANADKNSQAYFQAQANAQRVADKNKKK